MRALALDVGLKRIGVALCIDKIAIPLEGIIRKNRNQAANEVKNLLQIHDISLLIVGIPKRRRNDKAYQAFCIFA